MKNMTLEHIAQACGGTYIGEECDRKKEIQGAVIDSRLVGEGYLFIPIRGGASTDMISFRRFLKRERLPCSPSSGSSIRQDRIFWLTLRRKP